MDLSGANWHTSSRSNAGGGECVEVAENLAEVVLVRDSKDRAGGLLAFTPYAWRAFLAGLPGQPR